MAKTWKAGPLEIYVCPPRFRLLRPSTWRRKRRKVAVLEQGPRVIFYGAVSEVERNQFLTWLDAVRAGQTPALDNYLVARTVHLKEGGE